MRWEGRWRALAHLHMEHTDYPLHVMHGYTIPTDEAITFCEFVRKTKKLSALSGIEGITKARREVLPYGALVLEELLKVVEPREVVFSVFGIREGLLLQPPAGARAAQGPALELLRRVRARCAPARSSTPGSCAHGRTSYSSRRAPNETPEERRLRHAACLLSDIGWRAHPDYRGEQSLNLIAHAALAGIDHHGPRVPGAVGLLPSCRSRPEPR